MRGIVNAYQQVVQVADNVERVAELGGRARRGGKRAAVAIVGMHRQARASRTREIKNHLVAGDLFHGDGDRLRALAQIETEWLALSGDVLHACEADPAITTWAKASVLPSLLEWDQFRSRELAGWSQRFVTAWSTFEGWQERVRRLRELARARGVVLASPEPVDLPKTIWQRGEEGTGGKGEVLWTMLKTIVYAAVGVTGVVTLYAVARDIKTNLATSRLAKAEQAAIAEKTSAP